MISKAQAEQIRLAVFDVDGVFSDGRIYYSSQGVEIKAFHVLDGLGIKLLKAAKISTAVVTARESNIITKRMAEVGIDYIYQGCKDKWATLSGLLDEMHLSASQVCYMGDDLPDLACMQRVGFAFAPAQAHPRIQQAAHYVTKARGGQGAVREACDVLLEARGVLEQLLLSYGAERA